MLRLLVTTAVALPNEDERRFVSSVFVFFATIYALCMYPYMNILASQQFKKGPRTMVECR